MARKKSAAGRRALESILTNYRYPLYAFLRYGGKTHEDAEDLLQEFYLKMSDASPLEGVRAERGRFRTYLLTILKNLDRDLYRKKTRVKRGGRIEFVSLSGDNVDERWLVDRKFVNSPEAAYDRAWAVTVLGRAGARLKKDFQNTRKEDLFTELWPRVNGSGGDDNEVIGGRLGMTAGAVSVAIGRLRLKYADALRAEIADLIDPQLDPENEIRELMAALFPEGAP